MVVLFDEWNLLFYRGNWCCVVWWVGLVRQCVIVDGCMVVFCWVDMWVCVMLQ